MELSFDVKQIEYATRSGNLNVEASGVVKSKKHFPYYIAEDGAVDIFKPLSKTKPLTTPLFAYAEVFWSNVINEYFTEAPRYQLAICAGYSEEEPKYYDYGTLVPSVCGKGEHLVNLLEFYRSHPDPHVNIDNYVNYCILFYDYTNIFESLYIQENSKIGEELAMQVLLSILKGDQNYHYENVAFICDAENNVLRLAPVIDHEFSTMFLFPEDTERNACHFWDLLSSIAGIEDTKNIKGKDEAERQLLIRSTTNLNRNIHYISEHYPNVVTLFLEKLEVFEKDIEAIHIYDKGYLFPCNSYSFQIGQARYKNNNEKRAIELEENMKYYDIDLAVFEKILKTEITAVIKSLRQELLKYSLQ